MTVEVMITHRVRVLNEPVAGYACNHPTDGLVFIESGAVWVNGRVSNHFQWRKILEGGVLDSSQRQGYWP